MHRLEVLKEHQRQDYMIAGAPPDEDEKWVPAFLGFPVKVENAGLSCYPWLIVGHCCRHCRRERASVPKPGPNH